VGRGRRFLRRIVVVGVYAGAAVVLYLLVAPLLPQRDGGVDAARAGAVARPKGVPRQVPEWAWTLAAWQARPGAERGRRPKAAPHHVPAWFWDWRTWRAVTAGSGAS